jgi:hypothetical protein
VKGLWLLIGAAGKFLWMDWWEGRVSESPQRRVHLQALKLLFNFGLNSKITYNGWVTFAQFPKTVTSGRESRVHICDICSQWLTFTGSPCSRLIQNIRSMIKTVIIRIISKRYSCNFYLDADKPGSHQCFSNFHMNANGPESLMKAASDSADKAVRSPRVVLVMLVQGPLSCSPHCNLRKGIT